ncbi:putative membrane protein [Mycobacteroides abscessus subsp. bolletii 1S-154-0310]|uniref:Putative membrane protein n=2 Tax=Mycobacteroides abscessus TaxID=36809 RepID=A0A829MHA5_9MYCO|nr:putative membrane protein [Mycobacteroides abscessus 5S-0304]EIU26300.1 putative membrane protein [Mycobacteroides abscessus 5S-0708]EIU43410.1 putative membrane protein [Mycobacteroides abscessus 5S-1215]EIU62788.1 putative membrane protein [Mycobacteroides abscessus subsp. bolletii 1S-151-0930]EIU67526.1 putative membrane protein [Mycobacteroides abscessus subsp. bolletii 1S-152-0914]EIU73366.1 putative membrane protein [Mycobacteroides abscessus subsp. bolletii 1S-153-0915]EIU81021.1 pu
MEIHWATASYGAPATGSGNSTGAVVVVVVVGLLVLLLDGG